MKGGKSQRKGRRRGGTERRVTQRECQPAAVGVATLDSYVFGGSASFMAKALHEPKLIGTARPLGAGTDLEAPRGEGGRRGGGRAALREERVGRRGKRKRECVGGRGGRPS